MKWVIIVSAVAMLLAGVIHVRAQGDMATREPFTLGTFSQRGRTLTGIVLLDSMVIALAAGDAAASSTSNAAPTH